MTRIRLIPPILGEISRVPSLEYILSGSLCADKGKKKKILRKPPPLRKNSTDLNHIKYYYTNEYRYLIVEAGSLIWHAQLLEFIDKPNKEIGIPTFDQLNVPLPLFLILLSLTFIFLLAAMEILKLKIVSMEKP